MAENMVFMMVTAMLKNFYLYYCCPVKLKRA